MNDLPAISAINESSGEPDSVLATALSILLEPSPVLLSKVVPTLANNLQDARTPITSYADLVDTTFQVIRTLGVGDAAEFISGHPRIGESKNLSNLSAKEQGVAQTVNPTPPEVLARLGHLNVCYERRFPGLRYITFVNGRSRATIVQEMEEKLGIDPSLSPIHPEAESLESVEVEGPEWKAELDRAIGDVAEIAKSRLRILGVE